MRQLVTLVSALLLIGCSTPAPEAVPVSEPATAAPAAASATPPMTSSIAYGTDPNAHMKHHFDDACVLHDAIVRGDLGAMSEAAGRLATHEPLPDAPEFAPELVEAMRQHAGAAKDATTLGPAVFAAGKLGVACGDCHARSAAKLAFKDVPKPSADATTLQGHMARHAWGINRMFEGLIANDSALWSKGVNEFAEAPLGLEVFGPNPPDAVGIASEMVHELGASGLTAQDQVARGKVYTQLLAACAQCHGALGRGPGVGVYSGK